MACRRLFDGPTFSPIKRCLERQIAPVPKRAGTANRTGVNRGGVVPSASRGGVKPVARNRLPFFIAGLGFGATLGLVLAPKRGEDTRADLLRAAEDGREFVAETSATVRTVAADVVERGIGVAESQKDLLQAALDAGLRAYRMADQGPG